MICAPTPLHSALIEEAAAAGKHIFCEKPVDFDLARIDAALAAVKKAGVKLQIGFNRRFDANFARVRRAVAEGEIGQPQLLHIVSRDPGPPPLSYVKSSGGIFMDMTIHDFDMARFLIGAEVEEVYTQAAVTVDPAIGQAGDLDTAVVLLKFANGVIGTIDNCRQAVYGYDQRVEVLGKKGAAASREQLPQQRGLLRGGGHPARPAAELLPGTLRGELRDRDEALRGSGAGRTSPPRLEAWTGATRWSWPGRPASPTTSIARCAWRRWSVRPGRPGWSGCGPRLD